MASADAWLKLVLSALATWRVTHLIVYEDGPWDVVARVRARAGGGFWGRLMDCPYCVSVWAAAAATLYLRPPAEDWLVVWLGLSGAACLLDRISRDPVVIQPLDRGGTNDAVLRTEPGEGEGRGGGAAGPAA